VKLKGISLFLLLCYLAILSHDIVPHVHHSECRVALSLLHANQEVHHSWATRSEKSASVIEKYLHAHSHHNHDHHHHHDPHHHEGQSNLALHQHSNAEVGTENLALDLLIVQYEPGNHEHSFPLHHHVSPDNEFEYLRLRTTINESFPGSSLLVFYTLTQPPTTELLPPKPVIRYFDYPFLISGSLPDPGATGVRGPPAFA